MAEAARTARHAWTAACTRPADLAEHRSEKRFDEVKRPHSALSITREKDVFIP
jgi:hypothetical protein